MTQRHPDTIRAELDKHRYYTAAPEVDVTDPNADQDTVRIAVVHATRTAALLAELIKAVEADFEDQIGMIQAALDQALRPLRADLAAAEAIVRPWHIGRHRDYGEAQTLRFANGAATVVSHQAHQPIVADREQLEGFIAEHELEGDLLNETVTVTIQKRTLNKLVRPSVDLKKVEPGTRVPAVWVDPETSELVEVPGVHYLVKDMRWEAR